jgi:hypothetical protein
LIATSNSPSTSHVYYLPIYFQSIKNASPQGSGVRLIPYLASWSIAAIVSGSAITALGPYVPWLWVGTVLFAIGCGLLQTLTVQSSASHWIDYQILAGTGIGFSIQVPYLAAQVVLPPEDVPTGNALIIFFNSIGGAVFVSASQNIFSNTLFEQLRKSALSEIQVDHIIYAGATGARSATPTGMLPTVLEAYMSAVKKSFIAAIVAAILAFVCTLLVEWRSVKGKKVENGGEAELKTSET